LDKSAPVLFIVHPRAKADLSRLRLIQEGRGPDKPTVVLLDRAAKDGAFVFDNEAQRLALMGGPELSVPSDPNAPKLVIRGGGRRVPTGTELTGGWNIAPSQDENPLLKALGVRDNPFQLQPPTKMRPLDVPSMPSLSPWSGERKKTIGDSKACDLLIIRYGSAEEALGAVISARGGDSSEVPLPERLRKLKEIRDATGMTFKDPLSDASVDDDLMHLDHYLNAYAGTRRVLPPEEDDWWITKKTKTVSRSAVGFVGGLITTSYEGVKALDQATGWGTGKLVGYDFNAPNASRASWSGWWSGVKGSFTGSFDEEP